MESMKPVEIDAAIDNLSHEKKVNQQPIKWAQFGSICAYRHSNWVQVHAFTKLF
jgi:hypothetical protein